MLKHLKKITWLKYIFVRHKKLTLIVWKMTKPYKKPSGSEFWKQDKREGKKKSKFWNLLIFSIALFKRSLPIQSFCCGAPSQFWYIYQWLHSSFKQLKHWSKLKTFEQLEPCFDQNLQATQTSIQNLKATRPVIQYLPSPLLKSTFKKKKQLWFIKWTDVMGSYKCQQNFRVCVVAMGLQYFVGFVNYLTKNFYLPKMKKIM